MDWELPKWLRALVELGEEIIERHGLGGLALVVGFIVAVAALIAALKHRRRPILKMELAPPRARGVAAPILRCGIKAEVVVCWQPSASFVYDGVPWVTINAGDTYTIRVDASEALREDSHRVLIHPFVDGRSALEDSNFDNPRLRMEEGRFPAELRRGYILGTEQPSVTITGKRISAGRVAPFKAVDAGKAAAVAAGAGEAVGTIVLLCYRDTTEPPKEPELFLDKRFRGFDVKRSAPSFDFGGGGGPSRSMSVDVGTAFEGEAVSLVRKVHDFEPAEDPFLVLVIQYRSAAALDEMGVSPAAALPLVNPVAV